MGGQAREVPRWLRIAFVRPEGLLNANLPCVLVMYRVCFPPRRPKGSQSRKCLRTDKQEHLHTNSSVIFGNAYSYLFNLIILNFDMQVGPETISPGTEGSNRHEKKKKFFVV